jgi:hypothetical protein
VNVFLTTWAALASSNFQDSSIGAPGLSSPNNSKYISHISRTTMVPFQMQTIINRRNSSLVNTSVLLFSKLSFYSFVDCRISAQIADFIRNAPNVGAWTIQASNNGDFGTAMARFYTRQKL